MTSQLEWRKAICTSGIDLTARYVGLVLDTFMDKRGFAWPSYDQLAARAQVDRRTVIRAVDRLEEAGLVAVIRSRGRASNRYQALYPNSDSPDTVNSDSRDTVNSDTPDTVSYPQQCHTGPSTVTHGTFNSDTAVSPEAVRSRQEAVREAARYFEELQTRIKNGSLWDATDLEAELSHSTLTETQKTELRRQVLER